MTDDLIGKKIGGYEIEAKLGQGGMATVYRAMQTSMNRTVALKILPRHFMRDDTYLQRFEREVQIITQLEHRNIIPVYDYGEYDGQPYIAMRYMPAGTVDDLLNKGPLTLDHILKIMEQIAPALDYAHGKNVLHRDLKPSNVLLDDDGGAYLTDFGIARILGSEGQGTTITTQGVVGTPSYMSPEQAQGHNLDGRSDVYSLGVMVFEMATGRRPFENETPYGIAVMQVTTPPPQPRTINPTIPPAVEQVILKALKKQPDNRYQTAIQLSEALRLAVERPDSIYDTQPRPIAIRDIQAAQAAYEAQQHTVPSPPVPMPPVMSSAPGTGIPPSMPYTAPTPSQAVRPALDLQRRPYLKRKRSPNMWLFMIAGGLIGCALLSAMVVGVIVAIDSFLAGDITPSPTVPSEGTSGENSSGEVPGIADSPDDPTAAPTDVTAPIGVRPMSELYDELVDGPHQILYFAERDRNYDIYLYDLETGQETRLTRDAAVDSYPMISPDGTRIVFQSNRDGDFDLYMMDINGSDIWSLTDNNRFDRLPSWSPDGEWVVYSSDTRGDGTFDLYRISASGGEPELLFSNGQRNSHPRYTPDGRSIVFTTGDAIDSRTWEIARLDLETGDVVLLTDNDVRDASPNLSPDGQTIVYVTDGDGRAGLATVPINGGAPTLIYDGPGYEWGAAYDPSGQLLLFNAEMNNVSTLYIMRADGGDLNALDNNQGGFYPTWIP